MSSASMVLVKGSGPNTAIVSGASVICGNTMGKKMRLAIINATVTTTVTMKRGLFTTLTRSNPPPPGWARSAQFGRAPSASQ